jgi:hypothetical protein
MSLARFRVTVLAVAATAVTTFGHQEPTVLQPPVFQKGPDGSPARPQEALAAFTAAALAVPADSQSPGQATPATDGFIRQWLVLAPIPLESESGATEIDIDLLGDEGQVTPTAGDALAFGNQVRRWTPYQAPDFFIDFLAGFGQAGGDYMGGYAVAYVWAESEMEATLAVGTNDQGKAWLNGKEVIRFAEARGLDPVVDDIG